MASGAQRVMAARAIAFYSGFAIMTFEVILARVLTPFFGSSVYTWGAVIGVFLTGMTVGFFVGGWLADRLHDPRWAGFVAGAAGLLLLATPPLTEPIGILLLDSQLDPRWGAA
ncbi:MAG: fused MFS/spermidine synthase, partial [Caulobacterales bacterium]|nr:fused MFS/spermidine synthase [Caulobacterales bacterium]